MEQSREKLIFPQLVKKFPAFYGTRRYITVFTNLLHLILLRARTVPDSPSHFLKIHFNIINPIPRPSEMIRNIVGFYGEELLPSHPTPKLEDHLSSAVCDYLFNIFTVTLYI